MIIEGLDNPINALDRYESELENRGETIPSEFKNNLVDDIARYPSIKTGAYIQAVDYHVVLTGELMQWTVDTKSNSKVTYDGFLEFATWNRGRKSQRPARKHNETAIKNSDLEPLFDDIADNAFYDSYVV